MSQISTTNSMSLAPAENADGKSLIDRLFFLASVLGAMFLCVMAGLLLAVFKTTPFRWTQDAVTAATALFEHQRMLSEEFPGYMWERARFEQRGLVQLDPATADRGYTLYTSGEGATAILLDMQGQEVHRWQAPLKKVLPNIEPNKASIPDRAILIRRAHLFPNGDLLALYETPLWTPNGLGLAKLDRNSELVWSFDGNCHHDFAVDEHGQIFVLTHRLQASPQLKHEFGGKMNIEDYVTILSGDGKLQKEFSLLKALCDSPLFRHSITLRDDHGDVLHANTINLVGEGFAKHHPAVKPGDLMICFRNLNLVVVVDPESESIVWATSGPWHFPHDCDPLDNGNIMIFANRYTRPNVVGSRVIEFDPTSDEIVWQFAATPQREFRSDIRSTQQLLANGNVLICESDAGRILEVTRGSQIAFEYVNPVRGGNEKELIPVVAGVVRYEPEEIEFLHD